MGRRVARPASLLLVALLSCADAVSFAHENRFQPTATETAQPPIQHYFAIMGQVARPGVYDGAQSPLELTELVRWAGGLTGQASGSLRIIRRGRPGQQVYFTPQLHFTLADGDLIVADSRGFANHRGLPGSSSHRVVEFDGTPPGVGAAVTDNVELGLVQLIGRPVILDVPAGRATLAGIFDLLNQPISLSSVVTVLRPSGSRQEVSGDDAAKIHLSPGTVLVFDPRSIDARTLPRLPAVIRAANDSPKPLTTLPEADRERAPKSVAAGEISVTSPAPASPSDNSVSKANAIPDLLPSPTAAEVVSAFVARKDPAKEPQVQEIADGSSPLAAELTVDDLPQPTSSVNSSIEPDVPVRLLPKLQSTPSPLPGAGALVPFAVIGGVFVLVFAVLRSMAGPVTPATTVAMPSPSRRAWSLNDLIEDRIPIGELPLPFPAEVRIHGTPHGVERQSRVDRAQSIQRPHFLDSARKPARSGNAVEAGGFQQAARAKRPPSTPATLPKPPHETVAAGPTAASELEPAAKPVVTRRVDRAFLSLNGGRS